jgi:uncharacterized protein (TIGR00725 family)
LLKEAEVVQIGVIGAGHCSSRTSLLAEEVGREVARVGAVLVCGGLGGVMEAAARGAQEEGGITVGILPGDSFEDANPFIQIPVVTGLGHARNVLVVRSAQALIAVKGGYGTLSEVALALKMGKPVIGLHSWDVSKKIIHVETPQEAVKKVLRLLK